MSEHRSVTQLTPLILAILVVSSSLSIFCLPGTAFAQSSAPAQLLAANVPDAPQPQSASLTVSLTSPNASPNNPPAADPEQIYAPYQPTGRITFKERVCLQAKISFGPTAFIVPAYESGIIMADPPSHYPREWSDGGGAFGRNYGAEFGRHATGGITHFATAALLREDPRYYPSLSTNYARRSMHALIFTLVDRSDSGHRTFAVSNLAGSAAAGFVTMAYMPDGFNDTTHAYQRAAIEVSDFAARNLLLEFSPEFARALHKFHVPDRFVNAVLPEKPAHP
ncbi:hypothetical protein [Acidicapsa ligni]|uniref:hypothetical protein n=1 Tax=Acidicapsa ligni TaxID=542300 RepID=UPI0021E0C063|nr:hypothetical protein [Acidicapsa ligni]